MGIFHPRRSASGESAPATPRGCQKCGRPIAEAGADTCPHCGRHGGDRSLRLGDALASWVELKPSGGLLRRGVRIGDGHVAVVFRDGCYFGVLEPGYHRSCGVIHRLLGLGVGPDSGAMLVCTRSTPVEFESCAVRLRSHLPVDVGIGLVVRVVDARRFVEGLVREAERFAGADLVRRFGAEVRSAAAAVLAPRSFAELFDERTACEPVESGLLERLRPVLRDAGLALERVRLLRCGGRAFDELRRTLGEIERRNRELESDWRLREAVRAGAIDVHRNEQRLREAVASIGQEAKLAESARSRALEQAAAGGAHAARMDRLRRELEARRLEWGNRLDEQKLRGLVSLADAANRIERRRLEDAETLRRQQELSAALQQQQARQAQADLEVAKTGVEALRLVHQLRLETRGREAELELRQEAERMQLRGAASLQALVSTLGGETADRVLRLAELEMRKELAPERALALVAERSPSIAPAVAEVLKAQLGMKGAGAA